MKSALKICCALSFFLVISITAQESKKMDSLVNIYKIQKEDSTKAELLNEIIQIELYHDPIKVKDRINELITLSKKIGYNRGKARGYYRKGGYFLNRSELDSAEFYFKKSNQINTSSNDILGILNDNEQIALVYMYQNKFDLTYKHLNHNIELYETRDSLTQKGDFKFIGSTYHSLTNAYTKQGMYHLALKSELRALKLYELTNDELYIADAHNSLGAVENELENYQEALFHLEKAYKTYEKNNDISFQITALTNIGNSYYYQKSYQKGIMYFEKGIDFAKTIGHRGKEAKLWSNLGNIYENLNNIEKAIDCQKKAIELYKELGSHIDALYSYLNIGNLYRKTNDFEKSKHYLDKVIEETKTNSLTKVASLAYDFRSKLFEKMKKYDLALNDHQMFTQLKDSMFNETKSKQIEELRTIYDIEKKEQQIALQEKEIDLLEERERNSLLQKILMGVGLLLSLIGFYALRQKMKRNKLEKEKVDAELEFKKKELTSHALNLARKNETLENLKQKAKELKASENAGGYQQLIQTINFDLQDDNNWKNFSKYFEEVHKDFNVNVKTKYPEVTSNELRLMALLKMNLTSKEIANILNISQEGIKKARYRLRKKLDITSEDSLQGLVLSL